MLTRLRHQSNGMVAPKKDFEVSVEVLKQSEQQMHHEALLPNASIVAAQAALLREFWSASGDPATAHQVQVLS